MRTWKQTINQPEPEPVAGGWVIKRSHQLRLSEMPKAIKCTVIERSVKIEYERMNECLPCCMTLFATQANKQKTKRNCCKQSNCIGAAAKAQVQCAEKWVCSVQTLKREARDKEIPAETSGRWRDGSSIEGLDIIYKYICMCV
ncbi:unnamed protein product [Ceratitis capitata]|uniref:(Mediterranean fruit fly) hypothetical protein n=1 Tax=Ceratitis capitata TaxID=7213 RepID=A0A811UVP5_CERCA|nr:unnamed protein product [Ceratitis capitata]